MAVEVITLIITTVGTSIIALFSLLSHIKKVKLCCCKSDCTREEDKEARGANSPKNKAKKMINKKQKPKPRPKPRKRSVTI
jgi:hypothetical protein